MNEDSITFAFVVCAVFIGGFVLAVIYLLGNAYL